MVATHPNSTQIFARVVSIQDAWDDETRRRRRESGQRRREELIRLMDDLLESSKDLVKPTTEER